MKEQESQNNNLGLELCSFEFMYPCKVSSFQIKTSYYSFDKIFLLFICVVFKVTKEKAHIQRYSDILQFILVINTDIKRDEPQKWS